MVWLDLGYEEDREAMGTNCRNCREGRLPDTLVSGAEVGGVRLGELVRDVDAVPPGDDSLVVVSRAKGLETTTSEELRARYHAAFTTLGGSAGAVKFSSSVRSRLEFVSKRVGDSAERRGPSSDRVVSAVFLKILERLDFNVALGVEVVGSSYAVLSETLASGIGEV